MIDGGSRLCHDKPAHPHTQTGSSPPPSTHNKNTVKPRVRISPGLLSILNQFRRTNSIEHAAGKWSFHRSIFQTATRHTQKVFSRGFITYFLTADLKTWGGGIGRSSKANQQNFDHCFLSTGSHCAVVFVANYRELASYHGTDLLVVALCHSMPNCSCVYSLQVCLRRQNRSFSSRPRNVYNILVESLRDVVSAESLDPGICWILCFASAPFPHKAGPGDLS